MSGAGAATGAAFALGEAISPWVLKKIKRAAGSALTGAAKRKFDDAFAYIMNEQPIKFRKTQYARLPRYQRGMERVTGVYGRFRPTFGKELKFFDSIIANNLAINEWKSLQGITQTLNVVGKGNDPNQRIGRNFIMRSLQFRFKITMADSVDELTYRIILVWDKQCNGEIPKKEDIFQESGPSDQAWASYRNLANISRFEFLWDKTYTFNAQANRSPPATAQVSTNDTYYKKVNIKVEMSGTGPVATVTEINDNSLTLWSCTSNSFPTTPISGKFRIRFTG